MSLLSILIPTYSTKSWFETVLSEGICPSRTWEWNFLISLSLSLQVFKKNKLLEMFTRPESDRVVYWKRHYHGLETSAFVFFVGRVTTMNRIDMSFEVRLSVNRLSISSVQNRAVTFKIWSEVLLQSRGGLCFTFIITITCACC